MLSFLFREPLVDLPPELALDVRKISNADAATKETEETSASRVICYASLHPSHAAAERDVIADLRAVAPDIQAPGVSMDPIGVISFETLAELTDRCLRVDHRIDCLAIV